MTQSSSINAAELSAALATGDEQAFERLFRAYLGPLSRFVYGYVKRWEVAEDIVHDVFVQLWLRHKKLEPVRDLDAYLYTIARYEALDHLRHETVKQEHQHRVVALHRPASAAEPEEQLLRREAAALVHRALDALPPRQREIILLRWERQASYDDIAAQLGISPKTVDAHLRRAFENLRKLLPAP